MKNREEINYIELTPNELNKINGGSEWTDSVWNFFGKIAGALVSGDTFRHEYGRTGYF